MDQRLGFEGFESYRSFRRDYAPGDDRCVLRRVMETRKPSALLTLPYSLSTKTLGSPGTPPRLPLRDHPFGVSWRLDAACWEPVPGICARRPPCPPLPLDGAFEPTCLRKRNERERQRVRCVNQGYARLREHLPRELADRRLSKVETLRAAIGYIKHLQELLARHTLGQEGLPGAATPHRAECNSDGESKASSAPSPCSEPDEACC